jgi:hypothetical protein
MVGFDAPEHAEYFWYDLVSNNDWFLALDWLYRMNVTETSLFPGLDGFARSLRYRLNFWKRHYRSGA